MNTKKHFNQQASLQQQIAFVLSNMPNTSADEIAMELMELKGIASEAGVARLVIDVAQELKKMQKEGEVKEWLGEEGQERYMLL